MSLLDIQGTTVFDYAEINGRVYIFSDGGVDVYTKSQISWERYAYASILNCTNGAVNDNGIWVGTSDSGVWHCPDGAGDLTSQLQQYYAVSNTQFAIQSDNINHICARGTKLLVTHDAGADYFPAPGEPYQYADASGCDSCSINGTYIAYAVASGLHTLAHPTADWDSGDATVLTTGSSPALSSNTVNHVKYGAGNNLFIACGSGVDVYDYSTVTNYFGGSDVPYVWPNAIASTSTGELAYIDNNDDVIIYDLENSAQTEVETGTFAATWIDINGANALYDNELDRHSFINGLTPAKNGVGVNRGWTLYLETGNTVYGLSSSNVTLKINGATVSPTFTAFGSGFSSGFSSGFGGEGFAVTYTPPSASGYRKTVDVELTVVDNANHTVTESWSFTTETATNESPSATQPPNVIVYKDLSLTVDESEDIYNSVNVNWSDEQVMAYIVDEEQAEAFGTVMVENNIYHKQILNLRVLDSDAIANNTQDINVGDIMLFDCSALGLTNQKCEVLAKQRDVSGDAIYYNLQVAYYTVYA